MTQKDLDASCQTQSKICAEKESHENNQKHFLSPHLCVNIYMDTKTCKCCGIEKMIEDFREYSDTRDKKIYTRRKPLCKDCENQKVTNRRKDPVKRQKERDAEKKRYHADIEKSREKYRIKSKKYRKQAAARIRKRRKEDSLFCMILRCRSRIARTIDRKKNPKRTKDMLGCSWEDLFKHIENKFQRGMSWENRGEWHIDHIIPLSSAKNQEEIEKLCHYTNLQPLWASENLQKGKKTID